MAVTATPYGQAAYGLGLGRFDFSANTLKCALTTSSYTPNVDTHDYFNDITNEISGTGYTSGGATLSSVSWSYDSTNNWALLTAAAVVWSTATFTARYGIVYVSTGTSSTSPLISYIDFGADQSPAAVNFTIDFSVNGILKVTVA